MKKFIQNCSLFLALLITSQISFAQKITVTLTGTGVAGFNGDGYPGVTTQINNPFDVVEDASNNLYFVDKYNGRIRVIYAATGVVQTIAGGGSSAADGIPATNADIGPSFMCIDGSGNLFFTEGSKVRAVNLTTGIITTVAGTGVSGYSGDGGPATAAQLSGVQGICRDASGNLYFAESSNNVIRKVAAGTGIISTVAGNGTTGYTGDGGLATAALLASPYVVTIDASGNLFIGDQGDGLGATFIRELHTGTGIINTIAGIPSGGYASGDGGLASAASVGWVYGMCTDGGGNLYLCDVSCSCREIDMTSGIINTLIGSDYVDGYNGDGFSSILTYLSWPHGVFVDNSGNIFVADASNNRFRKAIQLIDAPVFAFGEGQTINPCPGLPMDISNQLAVAELDSTVTEIWVVLTPPTMGTLTGFPFFKLSNGQDSLTTPYGLSYTTFSGYSGTDSFQIQVTDGVNIDIVTIYVAAPAVSGHDTVCAASLITLTDPITAGSAWNLSNGNAIISSYDSLSASITGVVSGADTIVYSLFGQCGAGSTTSAITVLPAPIAGTITGIDYVTAGSSTSLTDVSGGGVWSTTNPLVSTVSASGLVTGVSAGVDSVVYTVTNSCGTTATWFSFTVNSTTGIQSNIITSSNQLLLYPNPSTDKQANIKIVSPFNEPVRISIKNVLGEEIKVINMMSNEASNQMLEFPAGSYLLTVTGEHILLSGRLVIE